MREALRVLLSFTCSEFNGKKYYVNKGRIKLEIITKNLKVEQFIVQIL